MQRYVVRFDPSGLIALAEAGETVLDVARKANIPLIATCGGRTNCGTCAVRVLSGSLAAPSKNEQGIVDTSKVRLACRARISGDVSLALVTKPRGESFKMHDGCPEAVAIALDLGTTNLSLAVIDTKKNEIFARATVTNAQSSWGGDVLSRLSASLADTQTKMQLRDVLQEQIVGMLVELGIQAQSICRVLIAGNSVVSGLLVGDNLESLGAVPFEAPQEYVLNKGPLAHWLERGVGSGATVEVLAPLAAFVGGDTRALLTTLDREKRSLLIDIGTNIECVYFDSERVILGSAPAGSAFAALGSEGSELLSSINRLLKSGLLSRDGLLLEDHESVTRNEEGILFALAGGERITQLELREIQLGKAALSLLVHAVLEKSGIKAEEIERLLITGAFGAALSLDLLYETSILPEGLRAAQSTEVLVEGVLTSAIKMLVNDYESLDLQNMTLINVAEDTYFKEKYLQALSF